MFKTSQYYEFYRVQFYVNWTSFGRVLTLNCVYLYQGVSFKMLHVVTPSLSVVSSQPSTSKQAESSSSTNPAQLDFDEDVALRSRNLSSTLHKLYLWEKKLYNEVKVCCVVPVTSSISLYLCTFLVIICS